jgi:hypothetical protein
MSAIDACHVINRLPRCLPRVNNIRLRLLIRIPVDVGTSFMAVFMHASQNTMRCVRKAGGRGMTASVCTFQLPPQHLHSYPQVYSHFDARF